MVDRLDGQDVTTQSDEVRKSVLTLLNSGHGVSLVEVTASSHLWSGCLRRRINDIWAQSQCSRSSGDMDSLGHSRCGHPLEARLVAASTRDNNRNGGDLVVVRVVRIGSERRLQLEVV